MTFWLALESVPAVFMLLLEPKDCLEGPPCPLSTVGEWGGNSSGLREPGGQAEAVPSRPIVVRTSDGVAVETCRSDVGRIAGQGWQPSVMAADQAEAPTARSAELTKR